ncbi:MAG: TIGR03663 family protein [Chloroflexi bacterium]|nr:TIGR03663 family protein [Chloroflexota bacterium]
MIETQDKRSWLDRPLFATLPVFTGEMLLFIVIIILMAVSRLFNLGVRVMSHDESLHAYYSWLFSIGQGYQHTPTTHGPLQFHLLALTYFLFGDNAFTARLPHAIASILTVVLLWNWRRYLGRAGMLVAAGLVLISPYMLYYGRYARNEAFVALLGVLTLYAILRYLETGKKRHLLLLTAATALHFTVKETAFIYTAQALLFLAFYLVNRVTRSPWKNNIVLNGFIVILSVGVLLIGAALGVTIYTRAQAATDAGQTTVPLIPGTTPETAPLAGHLPSVTSLIVLASIAFVAAAALLVIGYGWKNLRRERSFDMLILLGTFVLPQLAPLPVKALGWNPLDYIFTWPGWNWQALWTQGPVKTASVLIVLVIIAISVGLLWDWKRWLVNAALFWGIYIFFYSSVFTNWTGLATGVVGSLGYWLEQQGVHRGSQPWYYYLLIQIPLYEYLPALGLGLAAFFGLRRKSPAPLPHETSSEPDPSAAAVPEAAPTFGLLIWWALSSLLAFSIAGEKMPWLTVHITLPMILLTGWGLGMVIERLDWSKFRGRGGCATVLLVIFFVGLTGALVTGLGVNPPFQGKTLAQLSATGVFLFAAISALVSAGGLVYLQTSWQVHDGLRLAALVFFSLLAVLTARTAVRAAYLHPNDATEYLVYAHGASGIKDVMAQIDKISSRTAGGQNLTLAYDNSAPDSGVAWPFTWYLRHYPNKTAFDQPGSDLRGVPVIIVDPKNFDAIKAIVGNDYYRINYIRMVWPNQDYFNLTWARIKDALTNPSMRAALWQIWINRDYSKYAEATGNTGLTVPDWNPSDKMQLFIRKDVAAEIWDYGVLQATTVQADPYEQGRLSLPADLIFGVNGTSDGQFNTPHGIAIAPDGTLYVADTNNNRIQHFSADGQFLNAWGSFGDSTAGDAPSGTFNQPWAVAVSPDGEFVYVADTWNHRIQKFTASGTPLTMWGTPLYDPTNNGPFGIWGPRGIAVDARGRVFVADTGNKRILVYDADGNFIMQIGSEGLSIGQFEEPVGLAFDPRGYLYVADTWNQRVQVFAPSEDGSSYSPFLQWDVAGWYGESLDNKPYLAADNQGHIFVTDPEAYRILEFKNNGEFIRTWGEYGIGAENFGLASAIAVDVEGHVWVSDPANNRLMRFTMP